MLLHTAYHTPTLGGGHNVSAPQSFIPNAAAITYVKPACDLNARSSAALRDKSSLRPATR
jgi:hypothetical protein